MESLEVARLRLVGRRDLVGSAVAFVGAAASSQGMLDDDRLALEQAIEEACLNVVEHAYEGDETAHYEVVVEVRPTNLVVSVLDRGLPFDLGRLTENMGMRLMRSFADRVEFRNLGKDGKRVELVKSLPYRSIEAYLGKVPETAEALRSDVELELRLMRPEDTASLARCAYRCYGFSYSRDTIYWPDKFEVLLHKGLIVSAVALTPDGEVVAHLALSRTSLDDKIADSGQAVTDPRVRGRKLFTKLKKILAKEAKRLGLLGIYSESVTIHSYTQKANLKLKAVETALLLGFAPASVTFKQIGELPVRSAAMMTYLRVNEEPHRVLYPPPQHREILQQIYVRLGLNRSFNWSLGTLIGESRIDGILIPDLEAAHLVVQEAGEGVGARVLRRMPRVEAVFLDLPLALPSTPAACTELEAEGFFFAGVVPEAHSTGDVLRMQRMHCAPQEESSIHTASDWGAQLKAYVLEEAVRVKAFSLD